WRLASADKRAWLRVEIDMPMPRKRASSIRSAALSAMKNKSPRSKLSAVANSPGPRPPYQADTTTESVNIISGATSPRAGLSKNLAVNATAVAAIATKYRNDLEGSADIFLLQFNSSPGGDSGLYPGEI